MTLKIGEKIKELRKAQNVTQEKLADYLNISYQAVSKWENGLALPDLSLIPALSNFFGVTADYLLDISLDNKSEIIENILNEAKKFTHTGEIPKSIAIIEEALQTYPNEHKLLNALIEYKVMIHNGDEDEWLFDIEQKANLILRDCNVDKIRHSTIVNLAFAYSFCGKREKVLEIADLLPENAYSKRELLSLAVPAKERADYKSECILAHSEAILCDILCISKHHFLWGDPKIAIDVCNRALKIIEALGEEGYILYFKANAYEDLSMAYAKLQKTDEMFNAMETVISIYEKIDGILSVGGKKYTSPLFKGLEFSKNSVTYGVTISDYERYYNIITNSKTLKPYIDDERFKSILKKLEKRINNSKT
ncbi:MAG: helix-turn-helix transcriptional regulator [Ruminococcaceae bacterium]|nr:helix-turn-helix transcriptional regulator [Oscillospiraceae bacterium]